MNVIFEKDDEKDDEMNDKKKTKYRACIMFCARIVIDIADISRFDKS